LTCIAFLHSFARLKKTMKKQLSIYILSISSIIFSCNEEAVIPSDLNVDFKSITVKDLPTGISPFVFNTKEDAIRFIEDQKKILEQINFGTSIHSTKNTNSSADEVSILSCTNQNGSYQQSVSMGLGFTYLNSNVYYAYCGNQFQSVKSINSSMTGITFGTSYSQIGYTSNVSPSYISYIIDGRIEYYIFFEGGLNVWSENVRASGGFSNQVIGSTGGGSGGGDPAPPIVQPYKISK
jgi:hypothetical protein